jgi:AcrR family transcriptional regulator
MTTTSPRSRLSRERILAAGVRIADAEGIGAVSMRRLGHELDVKAMSLYHHVASKDDVHAGMLDLVLGEVEIPSPGEGWKESLRRSAISAHAALSRHRWAASLTMSAAGHMHMRWMEGVLGTLRHAGFSAELTDHAYHALDSHITGFSLWQASLPFETKAELVELAAVFLERIPEAEYPYVVEHARQHLRDDAPSGATEFAFGLDLILDGLERHLAAETG